jgi:hypothetical protein
MADNAERIESAGSLLVRLAASPNAHVAANHILADRAAVRAAALEEAARVCDREASAARAQIGGPPSYVGPYEGTCRDLAAAIRALSPAKE